METEESSSLLSSTEVPSPSSIICSMKKEEKKKELEGDDDNKDNDDEENHQWIEFFENIAYNNNLDDADEGNDNDDDYDRSEGAKLGRSSSSITIKTEEEVPGSFSSKTSMIKMEEEVDEEVLTSIINNTLVWGDGTITGGVTACVDQQQVKKEKEKEDEKEDEAAEKEACEGSVPRIERLWNKMYQNLIAYKKQHQTTSVPSRYKEGQNLGGWVRYQRQCYKNKELSIERINYLESIGFVWKVRDRAWIDMYDRLVAYKVQYGTTLVPLIQNEYSRLIHNEYSSLGRRGS